MPFLVVPKLKNKIKAETALTHNCIGNHYSQQNDTTEYKSFELISQDSLFPFLLLPLLLLDTVHSLMEVEHWKRIEGAAHVSLNTANSKSQNGYSPMWARSEIFTLSSHPCNPAVKTTKHLYLFLFSWYNRFQQALIICQTFNNGQHFIHADIRLSKCY